jgi:hypothetical protein
VSDSGSRVDVPVRADDLLVADRRNFFKVELWTMDGLRVDLLFAGGSFDKARALFTAYGEKADSEVPEVRPTSIFLGQHNRNHSLGDRRIRRIGRVIAA